MKHSLYSRPAWLSVHVYQSHSAVIAIVICFHNANSLWPHSNGGNTIKTIPSESQKKRHTSHHLSAPVIMPRTAANVNSSPPIISKIFKISSFSLFYFHRSNSPRHAASSPQPPNTRIRTTLTKTQNTQMPATFALECRLCVVRGFLSPIRRTDGQT